MGSRPGMDGRGAVLTPRFLRKGFEAEGSVTTPHSAADHRPWKPRSTRSRRLRSLLDTFCFARIAPTGAAAQLGTVSTQEFHRQDRQDRKDSPTFITSEELPDRNLPGRVSKSFRVRAVDTVSSFACFACFAVELHYSGSMERRGPKRPGFPCNHWLTGIKFPDFSAETASWRKRA